MVWDLRTRTVGGSYTCPSSFFRLYFFEVYVQYNGSSLSSKLSSWDWSVLCCLSPASVMSFSMALRLNTCLLQSSVLQFGIKHTDLEKETGEFESIEQTRSIYIHAFLNICLMYALCMQIEYKIKTHPEFAMAMNWPFSVNCLKNLVFFGSDGHYIPFCRSLCTLNLK